jgi:hypothetical protein
MLPHGKVLKPFDTHQVTYAITNPSGRDYARIDFFSAAQKVGQILFGSAIQPGSYASLQGSEIDLYFPLSHFESILQLLRSEQHLALFVDTEPLTARGGLTNSPA